MIKTFRSLTQRAMPAGRQEKAFTLIELLIVIAIIAILTVAFLPGALKAPARARDAGRIKAVADIQASIEGYISIHNGNYPVLGIGPLSATVPAPPADDFTILGIGTIYGTPPVVNSTYHYFAPVPVAPATTPTFYVVGFIPENTANANSMATTATFTAPGSVIGEFTANGTSMYVVTGSI